MEEVMRDSMIVAVHSPKRAREDDLTPIIEMQINSKTIANSAQVKRLRKAKTHPTVEKDRTRGRYACLGHRMKHKRCPLDCPERRPKPNQEEGLACDPASDIVLKKEPPVNTKQQRPRSLKKNLQSEEYTLGNSHHPQQMARDTPISVPDRDTANWDSVEWEGLGWDNEHCLKENESWMDLKSSSHWEESKSRENLALSEMEGKPTDDLTKFEEEEIVDSWLNDDGFGNSMLDLDSSEGNETGIERRESAQYSNLEEVALVIPKILLTRDMLERWVSEPYFNRLVQGCFVRVKIGEYMDTPVYRIAHIEEVQDCFYSYNLTQGQSNKGLSLQIGGSKKVFPIVAVSNQAPTDYDFRTWQEEMEKSNICLDPSEFQQKEEIVRVLNHKYPTGFGTSQEVEPMVNEPIWNC